MATPKVRHSDGGGVYSDVVAARGDKSLDPDTQARIVELLREFISDVGGQSAAAKALGISQGYLSEILSGNRGGGQKLLRGLARHRPDILELFVVGGRSRSTHLDPRYPNREQAIAQMVDYKEGTPEEIRQAADAFAVALKSEGDLPVLEWVDQIRLTMRATRRGGPKVSDTEITHIGDEGVGETFRSVVARKKSG